MKKNILLLLLVAFAYFTFILTTGSPFENGYCALNRLSKNKSAKGIVVEKIYNSRNHANEQVILDNGDAFEWQDSHYNQDSFFYKIQKGDSLIKLENQLNLTIIRKDSSFKIDLSFECNTDS